MKKYILIWHIIFLVLGTTPILAQSPDWVWAKSAGYLSQVNSVTTDIHGDVYVTGAFTSQTQSFGDNTLKNAGNEDIYVVKYDPSGTVLCAKGAGGQWFDRGEGIATDTKGNVYITGTFQSSSITFDTITLSNSDDAFQCLRILLRSDEPSTRPQFLLSWHKMVSLTQNIPLGKSAIFEKRQNEIESLLSRIKYIIYTSLFFFWYDF